VISASRKFNIGLSPDLFTFGTMPTITRQGEVN
jgi:hypothetical protein